MRLNLINLLNPINLIKISLTGSALILGVLLFRALMRRYLPQRFFMLLWYTAILRLLLPLSLAWKVSPALHKTKEWQGYNAAKTVLPKIEIPFQQRAQNPTAAPLFAGEQFYHKAENLSDILLFIWLAGVLLMALYFIFSYRSCIKKFRESLPVKNDKLDQVLAGLQASHLPQSKYFKARPVKIRSYDNISSPLTYGIFQPVILLPKKLLPDQKTQQADEEISEALKVMLTHEYFHIKHMDALTKLTLATALAVHWFNPLVWLMYLTANRDIELSCDEAVVHKLGASKRASYALLLLNMEAGRGAAAMYNYFSKNALEERITEMIKGKKITIISIFIAAVFLSGAVLLTFAKSAEAETPPDITQNTEPISTVAEPETTETAGTEEEINEQEPTAEPESEASPSFIWVAKDAYKITGTFGQRVHPITGQTASIDHITISGGNPENTDILAAADAEVKETGFDANKGYYIILDHGNGLSTMYTHCKDICVQTGDTVKQGDTIATMGKTGRATGVCLGFYVYQDETPQNPQDYLPPTLVQMQEEQN